MEKQAPILVTLTSPTAAGKSHLLNYIRGQGLPCLISTTTRAPRAGEREGVDYYFISEEESLQLEAGDGFAELAIYREVRYGVTKKEFFSKLAEGVTFLIVEPQGIDHYVQPALDVGAIHLKYFIHTDPEVRLARFKQRVTLDIISAMKLDTNVNALDAHGVMRDDVLKIVNSHMDRLVAMTTIEMQWGQATDWTRILMGDKDPAYNLEIILNDVVKMKEKLNESRTKPE